MEDSIFNESNNETIRLWPWFRKSNGLSLKTRSDHLVKHLGFPAASIKAVTKFRQITGQVLVTDAVIHFTDIAFDVGDQGRTQGNNLTAFFPEPVTIGT